MIDPAALLKKLAGASEQSKFAVLMMLLAALVVVVFITFLLMPQIWRVTETIGRTASMASDIAAAEESIARLGAFRKNIEAYKTKVDFYEKRLPGEQEIPSLLENLSAMAKNANIKIIGIMPAPVTPKEGAAKRDRIYKEIPIVITAKSGYHELGIFLNNLENADRFMKVVDIDIKANRAMPVKHDVELIVCTYVLLQAQERL